MLLFSLQLLIKFIDNSQGQLLAMNAIKMCSAVAWTAILGLLVSTGPFVRSW